MKILTYFFLIIFFCINVITYGLTGNDNDILIKLQRLKNTSINYNKLTNVPNKLVILHNDTARLVNLLISNVQSRIRSEHSSDEIRSMISKTVTDLNSNIERLENGIEDSIQAQKKFINSKNIKRLLFEIAVDQIINFINLSQDYSKEEIDELVKQLESMKWLEITKK